MNRSTAETVVKRFSEELKRGFLDGENNKLQLTTIGLIGVKFDNAIVLYFKCKTNNDLINLKAAFDNRKIKGLAESDIRKLHSRNNRPITATLEWSYEDSERCDNYIRWRSFSATCIKKLPMEVLEIILTKAYALYFYRVQPRPRDKELFAMLSSVTRDWHRNIARRRFKSSLNRCLVPYFLSVTKRQTIIRSNRQYFVEIMESSTILIRRLEEVGCLTSREANYIESLQHNTSRNNELLTVARTMTFRKHLAFVESLHFCGQLKVAHVFEKGGVVFKLTATCARVSTVGEFAKRINENISEIQKENSELRQCIELFNVKIPEELEILKVQHLRTRKGKEYIVIWLWCKSQKSLRQLCQLAKSDQLLKRLDILMTFIWSKGTQHLNDLLLSFSRDALSLQFLKTLTLETMQFQRTVAVRQMSMKFSGEFNLPPHSQALTSLDDNIYVLTDHAILIHKHASPNDRQTKTVFPPTESPTVYPDHGAAHQWFIEACNQTKRIYVVRSPERRIWKFTTPEYNLDVWMHCMANLCSLSVTNNGNVLILKFERQENLPDAYCLEMYTKDAVLVYNINLDLPLRTIRPDSRSVEISPGNFVIAYQHGLFVKSVNFDTMTTTDQNLIRYSGEQRVGALYSDGRLIAALSNRLVIFDSRLNVEIILGSFKERVKALHYRKDKRQAMVWSSERDSVHIYTLQYEGEDLFDDDV